jgi:hypothetical protein
MSMVKLGFVSLVLLARRNAKLSIGGRGTDMNALEERRKKVKQEMFMITKTPCLSRIMIM